MRVSLGSLVVAGAFVLLADSAADFSPPPVPNPRAPSSPPPVPNLRPTSAPFSPPPVPNPRPTTTPFSPPPVPNPRPTSTPFSPPPIPRPTPVAPSNGNCGSDATGPKACPSGQYCQPWNPSFYQCRSIDSFKCGAQQVGVDFAGNDIKNVVVLLPEECCNLCVATENCHAYTFVNYNSDGQPRCYLKTGAGQQTTKVGAVSATVAKCRITPRRDIEGNDMFAVYGIASEQCCDKCAATSGCKAFSYVSASRGCYLKSGSDRRSVKDTVMSGTLA